MLIDKIKKIKKIGERLGRLLFLLNIFMILVSSLSFSDSPPSDLPNEKSIPLKNLENLLKNFHSMHAKFHEVSMGQIQNPDQARIADGELWIQKPGKFYWENISPASDWFVSNGDTLWHYEPDLLQATKSPLSSALSQTPLLLLSGEVSDIADLFTVTEISSDINPVSNPVSNPGNNSRTSADMGSAEFLLIPQENSSDKNLSNNAKNSSGDSSGNNSDGMIESMRLKFVNGNLSSFSLKSQLGQETTVTFSNVSWNENIPDSKFEFVLPAGADLFEG